LWWKTFLDSGSDLVGFTRTNFDVSFVFLADLIVFLLFHCEWM